MDLHGAPARGNAFGYDTFILVSFLEHSGISSHHISRSTDIKKRRCVSDIGVFKNAAVINGCESSCHRPDPSGFPTASSVARGHR